MKIAFTFCIGIFSLQAAMAQAVHVPAATFQVPRAAVVNLSAAPDDYMATVTMSEAPFPGGNSDKAKLAQVKQASAQHFPRRSGKVYEKAGLPDPVVLTGYDVHQGSGIPPDNYLAVSDSNRLMSVINSSVYIYRADEGQIVTSKSLAAFTNGLGLAGLSHYRFDPKVIYDPVAKRFITVILNGVDQNSWIIFGFSQTADPAGLWNLYKLTGNPFVDSTWFDYPAIAITENEFFLTGNQLRFNSSWQSGFRQSVIYQIDKNSGYAGGTLVYNLWDSIGYVNRPLRNLHPVKRGSAVTGDGQMFLSNRNFAIQNDSIFILKIHGAIGTPACSLTVTHAIADRPYGVAPVGRQKGSAKTLATNDGRVLGAFEEGDHIQFVSNSIDTVNGNAAIYHGMIQGVSSQNYSVTGKLISVDTLDFGYPNITYTGTAPGSTAAIISFNHSGPNRYPGFTALYTENGDYSDLVTLKEGTGFIDKLSQTEQRWGDYSGSQRLWSVPATVWVEGIYGKSGGYGNYAVKIGNYNAGVQDHKKTADGLKLFPNPAELWLNMEFTVPKSGPVVFYLNDINGKRVDMILQKNCQQGLNLLTFNASKLASGTYVVVMEQEGRIYGQGKFIKP